MIVQRYNITANVIVLQLNVMKIDSEESSKEPYWWVNPSKQISLFGGTF